MVEMVNIQRSASGISGKRTGRLRGSEGWLESEELCVAVGVRYEGNSGRKSGQTWQVCAWKS